MEKHRTSRFLALLLVLLTITGTIPAAPSFAADPGVKVTIRVEGANSTILSDKTVTTASGASLLEALQTAVGAGNVSTSSGFLSSIDGYPGVSDPYGYWMYYSTISSAANGVSTDTVENGATYVFYYQRYDPVTYSPTAAAAHFGIYKKYTEPAQAFDISLYADSYDANWNLVSTLLTGAAIAAYDVSGNPASGFSASEVGGSGTYNVSFADPGTYFLTAYTGSSENTTAITRPYCKVTVSDLYDTAFVFKDTDGNSLSGATLSVRDGNGALMDPVSGVYSLPAGDYTYKATKWGFAEKEGTFTVTAAASKEITLSAETKYDMTFNVTPGTAVITLTSSTYGTIAPEAAGIYKLQNGTYKYTVAAAGYASSTGNLTMNGTGQAINVNLSLTGATLSGLFENIAKKYYQDVSDPWYVSAVQAYQRYDPSTAYKYTDTLKQEYVNNAVSEITTGGATDATIALNIIGLKSIGIDGSNLVSLNKQPVNAVTLLQNAASTGSNGDAYRLLAYQQNSSYANASQIQTAITSLLSYQNAAGGYFTSSGFEDADTTAIAVAAMAKYYPTSGAIDTYGVKASVDKALAYLKSVQGESGAIKSWGTENTNSTAMAMIAYAAMGTDPASVKNEDSGANLIDGLLSFRKPTNDGFVWSTSYAGNGSEIYQGFLALIAAKTITVGSAFNVFDFSAAASAQGVASAAGASGNDETNSDYTTPTLGDDTITVTMSLQSVSSAFSNYTVTVDKDATVKAVFQKVMKAKNISYTLSGGKYVSMIDGLSEFDGGVNSGWMFTVNGTHPSAGISNYTVENGDKIVFHFTSDYTKEEGSKNYSTDTTASADTVKSAVTATLDKTTGVASATLSGTTLADFNKEIAASDDTKGSLAVVTVDTAANATAVRLTIPQTAVTALGKTSSMSLCIKADLCDITFDPKAVDTINSSSGINGITVSIAQADTGKLSEEAKAVIGTRPVFEFSMTSGTSKITGFNGGSAEISLPYTLKAGEDKNAVVVYYIDDAGDLKAVRGAYNSSTGAVVFRVSHFSEYAVGYSKVAFTDVADSAWYKNAVTFLAARGVTSGTDNGLFAPNKTLTRGQFLVMLLRAYEIEPEENAADNFSDAGNTYYTKYLAAAKTLAISEGVGDNKFAPDQQISRQDMFTLLYRALNVLGESTAESKQNVLSAYTDSNKIAGYAKTAMEVFASNGVITGSGGKLDPNGITTRAQMAQVLYSLLSE